MGQLARQSLQTSALLALRVVTQASMLVLFTRLLPPDVYGNLTAALSLAVVLGLLPSFGAGYVMLSKEAHQQGAVTDIWRYAWPLTLVAGVLLLIIYWLCAAQITDRRLLGWDALIWIGATEILVIPFIALTSFSLQASERVPLSQFIQWLPLGLRLLAGLPCFAVSHEYRLITYAALQFFTSLFCLIASFKLARRSVTLDWKPRLVRVNELRHGASYAVMQLVAANPTELDKAIAVRAVGAYDAGLYSASSRIMGAMVTPVVALLLTAQPRLFRYAHDSNSQGKRLISLIAAISFGWGTLSYILLAACSPALPYVLGTTYEATSKLLPWIALTAPFLSMRLSAGTILVALGRPHERIGFEIVGLLLLASGMIILPRLFGIAGLITAVIFAEAVMSAAGWWLVCRHRG